jgi:hypothetical protein
MSDFEQALAAHRNDALVPDAAVEAFLKPAREFALLSTGTGFAMSAADLADLVAVKERTLGSLASWFDRLIAMTEERRRNLVRYDRIGVVSLGCDCASRAVLARWGLKKTASLGEKSGPFDLAVHPPEAIRDLVVGGFTDYMEPEQLAYDEAHAFCINRRYAASFNHEVGPAYAADGFAKLREIYARRIDNFHTAVAAPPPLLLVAHVPHFIELLPERVDCLRQVRDHLATRRSAATDLVIVQTVAPDQAPAVEQESDDFVLRAVPLPTADYVWHWPQCYMTAEGQAYERQLVSTVAARLERLLSTASG